MHTAFLYYLVQTQTAEPGRPARRDAPPLAPAPAPTPEAGMRHATRSAARNVFAAMRALKPRAQAN
jgi:hypothetical protein